MSGIEIEPLHQDFAARVLGVDLTETLADEVVDEIRTAIDDYSFLCFPNQNMHDDAQLAFTRRLGEPEPEHVTQGSTGKIAYFGTVGNVVDATRKKDESDPHTRYQKGNNLWHSDSSFRLVPTFVSINHAYEVPGEGGETEFVSQRAAYDRLPGEMKQTVDDLQVLHDYVFSRAKVAPVNDNHAADLPPVTHRLVRTNPGNGKKNYFVGSHARSIIGWNGVESRRLIDDLMARATRTEDVYSHRWEVGDTVVWDNRCLLHRGAGYDANRWRRLMRQTRVLGTGPTLDE